MSSLRIKRLAQRVREHRAGMGVREAAREADISPATFSRVENGKVPDLETFAKICKWLGEDPAIYLGLAPAPPRTYPVKRLELAELALQAQGSAIARLERAVANLECIQHGRLFCSDARGAAALHDIRINVAEGDEQKGSAK